MPASNKNTSTSILRDYGLQCVLRLSIKGKYGKEGNETVI